LRFHPWFRLRLEHLRQAPYTPGMRAAEYPSVTEALLASALVVFAAGCAVLPPPPSSRTVTCITRTLADGLHLQVLEHRMRVVEPALVVFLDANPTLDGHLTLPDLLFLERLAESSHRDALRESVSCAAGGADQGPADAPAESRADQPDRLDPVERIKIGLIREALRFPVFLEAIAGVLGDDALDPSSEHGGLVTLESGEGCPLGLLTIPSSSVGDDNGYWLPPELFTAACLAFWHDHPFDERGGAGGPSGVIGPSLVTVWGDRWIAYLRGIDGLVFTPTDGGGFSIVFFNAEGEALDLGHFAPP
jgi:hypothetical protein